MLELFACCFYNVKLKAISSTVSAHKESVTWFPKQLFVTYILSLTIDMAFKQHRVQKVWAGF